MKKSETLYPCNKFNIFSESAPSNFKVMIQAIRLRYPKYHCAQMGGAKKIMRIGKKDSRNVITFEIAAILGKTDALN